MPVQRILRDACRISVQGFALAVLLFFLLELLFGLFSREALHDGRGSSSNIGASGSLSHIQHMLAGAGRLAVAQSRAILTASSADTTATAYLDAVDICPSCNASVRGDFANSKSFVTVPLLERRDARAVFQEPGQTAGRATLKRFLIHHIPLAASISGAWMSPSQQNIMLNTYFAAPDVLLSYNFDGLSLDLPTAYIYTRTGGKKLDGERRLAFFGMHHDTIRAFFDKVEREGYHDGAQAQDRQLLYIIVRDESQIDPELDAFFRKAGIPYLYFAIGPTKDHGIAQWNAVERAIEVVRDSFFGDGPVVNVDDDARMLPGLLDRVWRVKRLIAWPVGNMYPQGWLGLMCENGQQHHFRLGWAPQRVFPIDMQGFAINSSEIGAGRSIAAPKYVRFAGRGGESAFLEQISQNRDDLECLCDHTLDEACFYAWHNYFLDDIDKNSPPLTAAQYQRFYSAQSLKLQQEAEEATFSGLTAGQ